MGQRRTRRPETGSGRQFVNSFTIYLYQYSLILKKKKFPVYLSSKDKILQKFKSNTDVVRCNNVLLVYKRKSQ